MARTKVNTYDHSQYLQVNVISDTTHTAEGAYVEMNNRGVILFARNPDSGGATIIVRSSPTPLLKREEDHVFSVVADEVFATGIYHRVGWVQADNQLLVDTTATCKFFAIYV